MRARLSRRRLAGVVAAAAALIGMAVPANAAAAPASSPPPAHGVGGRHPDRPACTTRAGAGYAACLALVRTDVAAHRGLFASSATPAGYGPGDLQNAYDLPSATAGSGQTVAIVDAYDDPTAAADLAVYRAQYGLPACTTASGCFRKVAQDGSANYPPPDVSGGWEFEESLDVDMVSAICPRCRILLVEADNNALTSLGAAVDEAVKLGAKYVSNSYGGSESPSETTWDSRYYQHPGVAVTASAGDSGYGVEYPAASQYVTAVGGTTLTRDPGVSRGWTETVWGSGLGEGTGSGCSAYDVKPTWQADTGCQHRTVADVSADADPSTGVAVYDTFQANGWGIVGGTSVASPVIASTYALAGVPAAGSYPASYPYADTSALHDVTRGADGSCAPTYLCTAGRGYDGPTGWGTPAGVGAFKVGPHGTVTGTVTSAATGRPLAGAQVVAGTVAATTDTGGGYVLTVPPGSYSVVARDFGYQAKVTGGVRVANGQTVTENFALSTQPEVTLSGTVTDGSGHGWPLAATVSVPGTPVAARTNPATGHYQLRLPGDAAYTVQVATQYPGYHPVHRNLTIGTGSVRDNFALAADNTTCRAPGYRLNGPIERFTDWTSTRWSVVTPAGSTPWTFTNGELSNDTGGSGPFANVFFGLGVPDGSADHTNLISPVIDMTADRQPVLRFDQALAEQPALRVEADLSIDGGHTWSAIWKHSGSSIAGPDTETLALPAAAGQPDVKVRFQFIDTSTREFSDFWELDNIYLGDLPCAAIPGGLVTGQVADGNTGAPLDGATVTSLAEPHHSTHTSSTPAGRGFYFLFSPPGAAQRITAAMPLYSTATAITDIRPNRVAVANIALSAGQLAVTPGSVSVAEPMGQSKTVPLTFTNQGQAPLTVQLRERPGTVSVRGGAGHAAGAPLQRVPGTFSPLAANRVPAAKAGRAGGATDTTSPWTPIARYPLPIIDNAAADDDSTGDIYSVGGYDGQVVKSGYVYSLDTQAWTALPDMKYPREAPQAAFISGKLYVTGGWNPNDVPAAALEIYDPATRRWSTGASIPVPLAGASVTVDDGKMYVIGGCDANQCGHKNVQVYDPATNKWSTGAAYPVTISWESCGPIGARIYCAGGATGSSTDTAAAYAYSPASNAWSRIAPMPLPQWAAGYSASNGRLLVSGGIIGPGAGVAEFITNTGIAYDPATNKWTALPNSNATSYRGASACGFYRIGGSDSNDPDPQDYAEQLTAYSGCAFGKVPWLSESRTSFTLQPGQSLRVGLTLNAGDKAVTRPGTYATALAIGQHTPYQVPDVKVSMTVTPPST